MRNARYLALLRGVNVGGKNILPMKELAILFGEAGCAEVKTYIQSGNVVFSAPDALAVRIPALIAARIEEKFAIRTPLVLRSREELGEAIRGNPFLQAGESDETLHVYFLAAKPGPEAAAKLDPDRSPPDRFVLRNREVYLQMPNGMGRTKLTNAYFDAKLGTISTARNWRTVLKLYDLLQERAEA